MKISFVSMLKNFKKTPKQRTLKNVIEEKAKKLENLAINSPAPIPKDSYEEIEHLEKLNKVLNWVC